MKKLLLGFLFSLVLVARLAALPAGVSGVSFTTSQAQFAVGDNITITEVYATSPNFAVNDTVVVRGTYVLASQAVASLTVQITTPVGAGSQPGSSTGTKSIAAGSGSFELQLDVKVAGDMHVTFYSVPGGSSFGGIYFAKSTGTSTTPTTPTTPTIPATTVPPVNTAGVSTVPFATWKPQFLTGDSITISEVLATSPRMEPGDVVVVRGSYNLQSSAQAVLLFTMTGYAPGFFEPTAPNSRTTVGAGTGTFELAYEIRQPGQLHVSFYPASGGSVFGGIYFGSPANSRSASSEPAVVSATTNTGRFGNLSVRSIVGTGDNALVVGLTVTEQDRYVLIRGIGPTLGAFGLTGFVRKPQLSVYDAKGQVVATTGSWTTSYSADQRAGFAMLAQSVGAFPLNTGSDDAVLNLRLVPGGYTIVVASGDGQTGVALIEAYASGNFTLPTR